MIRVRDMSVTVPGATLLANIELEVAAGELVVLVGANGAGKSTLLSAIAGDIAYTGAIELAARELRTLTAAQLAAHRAVLRQRSSLTAAFTALEVVRLGQRTLDDAAAHRALADVAMAGRAHRSYPTLSGGEQQRVQLARVLAQLAPGAALLLDEPTSALDLGHQQLALACARRAAAAGHPVIMVLHDLALAARCADRIVMLSGGRILAEGPPAILSSELVSRAFAAALVVERTASGALTIHPA